jgi:hypothetical protein
VLPVPWRGWLRLVGIGLLTAATFGMPAPAEAGNVPTSITSTYELLPDLHRVHVTVVHTVTNQIPSTTSGNVTTDYYIDSSQFNVDPVGGNYTVSTPGGGAGIRVTHKEGFLSTATVTFPAVYYGQSRTITVGYDLISGTPRSGFTHRAGMAYANFCAFPGGAYTGDPEAMTILIPERFEVEQYDGEELTRSTANGKIVLSSGSAPVPDDPAWHGACVEAVDEDAFTATEHTSPSGIAVTAKSWPEDTAWQQAVSDEVGPTLDELEVAIGRPPDSDTITVQEVIAEELSGYAGVFDPTDGIARVSEDALDPLVAAHELAHAWFNDHFTVENWLWEGYAEYYGRLVTETDTCTVAEIEATGAEATLSSWGYLPPIPTDADFALVDAQYATACYVVTEVADRIGDEAMQEITTAVDELEIPYLGEGEPEEHHGPLDWRKWLDLADERGMVPAGEEDLDWLQDLLGEYGAAPDDAALTDRSEARAAYHELLADSAPWSAPYAIRDPMSHWQFDKASANIATAVEVDAAHDEAVELVPELADSTVVEDAYESAGVADDLGEALDTAEEEADAAAAVADAVAAAEAERNPIEAVGLLGADLATDAAAAVDDLVAGDYDEATSTAEDTSKAGAEAGLGGGLRLGGLLLVLAVAGGGIWFWRRRRAAQAALAEGPEDSADEAADEVGSKAAADTPDATDAPADISTATSGTSNGPDADDSVVSSEAENSDADSGDDTD